MKRNSRFGWGSLFILVSFTCLGCQSGTQEQPVGPNVILCMSDDLGWGDTGYNRHPVLQTPHLDAMAAAGLRFNRFYAGAPVCSPTRASALTGRHPYRYGIFGANIGHLPEEEITLAEVLRTRGYTTGHFGKWHLGTLNQSDPSRNRGEGKDLVEHYAPPWLHGFDVCFSNESKVPTWDPMFGPPEYAGWWDPFPDPSLGTPFGTPYYLDDGSKPTDNLEGDDSRIIMDRVLPFIRDAVTNGKPFLAVVWFHAPHLPVVAGPDHTERYSERQRYLQHYYGCITAMDEQIGHLRDTLRELGIEGDTMFWFCSDNGPERKFGLAGGSAGTLRGHKRGLFDGGVRVPGLLEWPGHVTAGTVTDVPASTSDYVPTVLDLLEIELPDRRPLDGVSLLALIEGKMKERPRPIFFETPAGPRSGGSPPMAMIGNRFKLLTDESGTKDLMFDLIEDPAEAHNLAVERPEQVESMRTELLRWQQSCRESLAGEDYLSSAAN